MLLKGVDLIMTDPNEVALMHCPTCGDVMDVQRSVTGYRGVVAAMSNHKTVFDKFICSHAEEKWHQQARDLKEEIKETSSKAVADLMEKELEQILSTRQATK